MSISSIASLLAAVGLLLPVQASAAQTVSDSRDEVIVTGIRDREKQIGAFVDALTNVSRSDQISRFDWAVCPAVLGLSDVQNDTIAQRLRTVAHGVGIRTAGVGCRPNVLVLITANKRELIEALAKQKPEFFDGISDKRIDALAKHKGPAAWHIEGRLDSDGKQIGKNLINDHYVVEMTEVPSRLRASTRPHFIASILVVELESLRGLSLTQLADYAAMRTFARTDPDRLQGSPAPSILKMFDMPENSPLPITMTDWDFNFLKGLYSADPDAYANRQKSAIRGKMRDKVGGQ